MELRVCRSKISKSSGTKNRMDELKYIVVNFLYNK